MTALYPFLLAAARVLYQADRNPGYYTLGDLAIVITAVLAGLAVVYALAAWLLRGRGAGLPAFVTFLAMLWLFGFDPAAHRLPLLPHRLQYVLLGAVALAGCVLLVRWLARRPQALRTVSVLLTLTGALLLLRFGAGITTDHWRQGKELAHSAIARELAKPIGARAPARGPARDVYLIVLDEYANAEVLRDGLGFDNSPFIDSLRALGFHVPAAVWSNYTMTAHSLPSLLNAAHIYPIARDLPPGSRRSGPARPGRCHSRTRACACGTASTSTVSSHARSSAGCSARLRRSTTCTGTSPGTATSSGARWRAWPGCRRSTRPSSPSRT
jgi:hypothetical protein